MRSTKPGGAELSQRARFPRSPPHQQARGKLQKQEIQILKEGCGKARGAANRQAPSSVSPCLPDPAPVTAAGRGTPGGAVPHRDRPSLLYSRRGRSAAGGIPERCPAAPGGPSLSPLRDRGAPRRQPPRSARTDTAAPLAAGHVPRGPPPISAARTRLLEGLESFVTFKRRLGAAAGAGSGDGPGQAPDSATAPKAGGDDPSSATCSVHARAQPCYA